MNLPRLLRIGILMLAVPVLAGCASTFAQISWLNVKVLLRTPDAVVDKIINPVRPNARLSVLWVGHATALVQMDDKFILTDPVFTRYVGGLSPRLVEPGIAVENLPKIDAVLVSHRHFDHLSTGSFPMMQGKLSAVVTPEGAGADIPKGSYQVHELQYWKTSEHNGLRITAFPVVHTGARLIQDAESHPRAFTGYVVEYNGLKVFFPGDTAYDEEVFKAVAVRFPAVDLALMPVGPLKPESLMLLHHIDPTQALQVADMLGATHTVPIHFGTFVNSLDERGEVEAALAKAATARPWKTRLSTLRIGEQRVLLAK